MIGTQGDNFRKKAGSKICFSNIEARPLLSIITVVFNGVNTLEKSIQSVLSQTYKNIEYIVIDGGSSDGTVEILKKYNNSIDYWISENDNGIYDAMNKGIRIANGQYVYHLGADDFLVDDSAIENVFKTKSSANTSVLSVKVIADKFVFWPSIDERLSYLNTLHHQGLIYPASVFKQYGLYNTNFKILADFEFNQRVFLSKKPPALERIDVAITSFSLNGVSSRRSFRMRLERLRLIKSWIKYISYKTKVRGPE